MTPKRQFNLATCLALQADQLNNLQRLLPSKILVLIKVEDNCFTFDSHPAEGFKTKLHGKEQEIIVS